MEGTFTFLPLGAIIQEFRVAGHNIVLGFRTADDYVRYNSPHFGATIGRVANRLKDATIRNLNGRDYRLSKNDGPHSLHGGANGWGKCVFDGPYPVKRDGRDALQFKYLSKDGDEGYPGTVEVRIWYTAVREGDGAENPKTTLMVETEVEFVGDECEETIVNVTNHSYFNLGNAPTIEGTVAQLSTTDYLPTDATGIPIGHIEKFSRDVSTPFILRALESHIDSTFIIEPDPSKIPLDTRRQPLSLLAAFSHPDTGMNLEVYSTEPAFQFYTGKYVDVPEVGGVPARSEGAGFCVEPSRYVNAASEHKWRGMTVLKRGEMFGCKTMYRAWKE